MAIRQRKGLKAALPDINDFYGVLLCIMLCFDYFAASNLFLLLSLVFFLTLDKI